MRDADLSCLEVVYKALKKPFIEAQDATARIGPQQVAEVVHKVLKGAFVDVQEAIACGSRHQIPEIVHKHLKSPFIDAQESKERSAYERLFNGR